MAIDSYYKKLIEMIHSFRSFVNREFRLFFVNIKLLKPAELFLCIALVAGIFSVFFTPFFQVPDEIQHFDRAYQVSEFHIKATKQTAQNNLYGGLIPASVIFVSHTPTPTFNYRSVIDLRHTPLNPSLQYETGFDNTAANSPVAYLPQALGIGLARSVRSGPIYIFYIGRLFNIIIWVILMYLAIRITPFGKWVFFIVGLNPQALTLAASLSPDATQISLISLLVAIILRLRLKKTELKLSLTILFSLLLIGIGLLKVTYVPLIILVFAVPTFVISKRKKIVMLILSALIASAWIVTIAPIDNQLPSFFYLPKTIHASSQIHYIEHNPLKFTKVILYNIVHFPKSADVENYALVNAVYVSPWIQLVYIAAVVFALTFRDESEKVKKIISRNLQLLFGLAFLASLFAIFLVFYLNWTPVGSLAIDGIQGRYLIPLTMLLIPVFGLIKINFKISSIQRAQIMLVVSIFSLMASFLAIGLTYY